MRTAAPHSVLCVLPKGLAANPFRALLKGYDVASADGLAAALRLARQKAYDLYVIHSPLGWADPAEICRRIRAFDAHTAAILYSVQPSAAERREALGTGSIQAYVARSDDVQNLVGTAGQLIMIAELRSMDAMSSGVQAMHEEIARRLGNVGRGSAVMPALKERAQARLKIEACRIFAAAGGSRANFERLWPSIYDSAVKRVSGRER